MSLSLRRDGFFGSDIFTFLLLKRREVAALPQTRVLTTRTLLKITMAKVVHVALRFHIALGGSFDGILISLTFRKRYCVAFVTKPHLNLAQRVTGAGPTHKKVDTWSVPWIELEYPYIRPSPTRLRNRAPSLTNCHVGC